MVRFLNILALVIINKIKLKENCIHVCFIWYFDYLKADFISNEYNKFHQNFLNYMCQLYGLPFIGCTVKEGWGCT